MEYETWIDIKKLSNNQYDQCCNVLGSDDSETEILSLPPNNTKEKLQDKDYVITFCNLYRKETKTNELSEKRSWSTYIFGRLDHDQRIEIAPLSALTNRH